MSFSGARALRQGQAAKYVTERCVIELHDEGLTVTEIAPGIDVERDVMAQAATPLKLAEDVREMDARLFQPGLIGLSL